MKQEFELTNAKILYPPMIQHLGKAGKYIQMSMKYCKESYGHLQCIIQVKREWQTRQFIGIWLQDKNIRVFDQVVFEPPPLVCNNDHFNMWIPFQIAKEPLVETGRDYWQDYCQFLNNLLGDEKLSSLCWPDMLSGSPIPVYEPMSFSLSPGPKAMVRIGCWLLSIIS